MQVAPGQSAPHTPVVLLASRDEVFARSLETVLGPAGFTVLRAYTARSAREQARRSRPDAVVLSTDLEDPTGLELCRQLRSEGAITPSTPMLLTEAGTSSRQSRLAALRAGADQLWSQPLDTEEFALRLAVGVRAKRDADAARADGLVDSQTGFWNARGLERWLEELLPQMARAGAPLAVAVFEPVWPGAHDDWALGHRLAAGLRVSARQADAVGRLGPANFAIVAPKTTEAGAVQLAERVLDGMRRTVPEGGATLRVGVAAVEDPSVAQRPGAAELLARAAAAIERGDPAGPRVRRWTAEP